VLNSPNRFVRAIRSGEIDSVKDLKAAFRELALATHPDLAGRRHENRSEPDAQARMPEGAARPDTGEAFIAVRAEYEAALANFDRHRFGASRKIGQPAPREASVAAEELWGCLSLMLKRGFPKEPRHEKETLRYEYARWRLRGAVEALQRERERPEPLVVESRHRAFEAFEDCLLDLKKTAPSLEAAVIAYLRELIDYASSGLPLMRVSLVRAFDGFTADARLSEMARSFIRFLSSELGIGPTLGA